MSVRKRVCNTIGEVRSFPASTTHSSGILAFFRLSRPHIRMAEKEDRRSQRSQDTPKILHERENLADAELGQCV